MRKPRRACMRLRKLLICTAPVHASVNVTRSLCSCRSYALLPWRAATYCKRAMARPRMFTDNCTAIDQGLLINPRKIPRKLQNQLVKIVTRQVLKRGVAFGRKLEWIKCLLQPVTQCGDVRGKRLYVSTQEVQLVSY
jgi:hypothetical protein